MRRIAASNRGFRIKKLFGKNEQVDDLLEASANEAHASTRLLRDYLKPLSNPIRPSNLDDFIQSRRTDKPITQQFTAKRTKKGIRVKHLLAISVRNNEPSPVSVIA